MPDHALILIRTAGSVMISATVIIALGAALLPANAAVAGAVAWAW